MIDSLPLPAPMMDLIRKHPRITARRRDISLPGQPPAHVWDIYWVSNTLPTFTSSTGSVADGVAMLKAMIAHYCDRTECVGCGATTYQSSDNPFPKCQDCLK